MRINRNKIDVLMARDEINITKLAELCGVSRTRMNVIINSRNIAPATAGRLARVLGVDVTEIIED